jgi:hypothetical protein
MMQALPVVNGMFNSSAITTILKFALSKTVTSFSTAVKTDTFEHNKQQAVVTTKPVATVSPRAGLLGDLMALSTLKWDTKQPLYAKLLNIPALQAFLDTIKSNSHTERYGILGSDTYSKLEQALESHHISYILGIDNLNRMSSTDRFGPKDRLVNALIQSIDKTRLYFQEAFQESTGYRAVLRPHYLASEAGANVLLGNKHEARKLAQNAIDEQTKQSPLFDELQHMFPMAENDLLTDGVSQTVGGTIGTIFSGVMWPFIKPLDMITGNEVADIFVKSNFNRVAKQDLCKLYRISIGHYGANYFQNDYSKYVTHYCKNFLKLPDDDIIFQLKPKQ